MELNFTDSSLPGGVNITAATVTIISDDIVEYDEEFLIVLEVSDPRISIPGQGIRDSYLVTIIDDDGKWRQPYITTFI